MQLDMLENLIRNKRKTKKKSSKDNSIFDPPHSTLINWRY